MFFTESKTQNWILKNTILILMKINTKNNLYIKTDKTTDGDGCWVP